MSTALGVRWPATIGRTPPHMSLEDEEIYRRWWPRHASSAIASYYDVRVGKGAARALPTDAPGNYASGWIALTQKRIDHLAEFEKELWIIEYRHAATSNAIGRLLQYKLLWEEDPVIRKPVRLWLITNYHDPDLAELAKAQRVNYEWV